MVLLLNDTLVKLFFSMKSSVGKCTCVHFGKLPEKWVNTSRMQMKYLSCCLDDIYCFYASIYGKLFPWEFTDGHVPRGEKIPCLAHSVSSILKKYSIPLFSILNRVSILMHFALNRVRIEGFQLHNPNQTSLKSSPWRSFFPYT